jgi:hypothetical protein
LSPAALAFATAVVVVPVGVSAQVAQPAAPPGFTYGAGWSSQYDSNVQRLTADAAVGSWINEFSVLLGFDKTYSRQHVYASAELGRVLYGQLPIYDYTHENLLAGWHMDLPDSADAAVDVTRRVDLAHFADLNSVLRDVISRDEVHATVDVPVATYWRPVVEVDASQLRNSNGAETAADLNIVEVDAGIRYQTGSDNQVDLVARGVRGTYPHAPAVPPDQALVSSYRERGGDIRAKWKFSGASTLFGRIGYVSREYDLSPTFPSFGGAAYDLTYVWEATARTSMTLLVLRETGATGDNQYLSSVTHRYRLNPSYAATAKIKVQGQFELSRYDYLALPSVPARTDNVPAAGVNVSWLPQRWLTVKIGETWEHRSSNLAAFAYTDRISSLLLQASF